MAFCSSGRMGLNHLVVVEENSEQSCQTGVKLFFIGQVSDWCQAGQIGEIAGCWGIACWGLEESPEKKVDLQKMKGKTEN